RRPHARRDRRALRHRAEHGRAACDQGDVALPGAARAVGEGRMVSGPERDELESDLRDWRGRAFPELDAARAEGRAAGRRRTLRWASPMLAAALVVLAGAQGWRWYQTAPLEEYAVFTARGEQKVLELAEGSRVVANTATSLEIDYSRTQRTARL